MSTLQTVSILERILLLREIPIFADLSPEDLKLVAEIARELVIGLSTVRTYTKSIYSKLDVSSRRAAVKRAAELGLI